MPAVRKKKAVLNSNCLSDVAEQDYPNESCSSSKSVAQGPSLSKTRNKKGQSQASQMSQRIIPIYILKASVGMNGDGRPTKDEIISHEVMQKRLREHKFEPEWITVEQCLEVNQRGSEVYILPVFSGPVFDHLAKVKCRVYGSLAVLTCLDTLQRLPKWYHPIFSVTLRNAVICFTGIDYDIREEKTKLILYMNGVVSRNFNEEVTHLVAVEQDPSSKKYLAAINRQKPIPIMSMDWIDNAWKTACDFSGVSFVDDDMVQMYRLKMFKGCVITGSGLSLEERSALGRLVEINGGKFVGEMKRGYCTHLVTDKNSGTKYRKAREWGSLQIVNMKWLTKSVEKGYRLPERLYSLDAHIAARCSTPKLSTDPPADFEVSAISGGAQHTEATIVSSFMSSQATAASWGGKQNMSNITTVGETPLQETRRLRSKNSSFRRLCNESVSNECLQRSLSSSRLSIVDQIDTIDIDALPADDYLESVRIFLCGIEAEKMGKWKRLINVTGASRIVNLEVTITHAVVGTDRLDGALAEQLQSMSDVVAVVKSTWLIECVKSKCLVNPAPFYHSLSVRGNDDSCSIVVPRVGSAVETSDFVCSSRAIAPQEKNNSNATEKLNANGIQSTSDDLSVRKSLDDVIDASKSIADVTKHVMSQNAAGVNVHEVIEDGDETQENLFLGYSFRLTGFDEDVAMDLCSMIEHYGGTLQSDENVCVNYLLCPLIDYDEPVSVNELNCRNIVSVFWAQQCVENSAIFNTKDHPLYRPISAKRNTNIFVDCVVALSRLSSAEKEAYTELLTTFGAIVQNRLAKNNVSGLVKNTHIVAGAKSTRTEAAQKWQLHIVDPSWVIESVLAGTKLPEPSFPFSDQPFKLYTGRTDKLWKLASAEPVMMKKKKTNETHAELREIYDDKDLLNGNDAEINDDIEINNDIYIPAYNATQQGSAVCLQEESLDDEILQSLMDIKDNELERSASAPQPVKHGERLSACPPIQNTTSSPANLRLKDHRAVMSQNVTSKASLVVTPSKFLDPTKKFIPNFDLVSAYKYLDQLDTPNTSLESQSNISASVSMVGRILEQAAEKTGKPCTPRIDTFTTENFQCVASSNSGKNSASSPEKIGSEKPLPRKLCDSSLLRIVREAAVEKDRTQKLKNSPASDVNSERTNSEHLEAVRNLEKKKLIEERLANLAVRSAAKSDLEANASKELAPRICDDSPVNSSRKRSRCLTDNMVGTVKSKRKAIIGDWDNSTDLNIPPIPPPEQQPRMRIGWEEVVSSSNNEDRATLSDSLSPALPLHSVHLNEPILDVATVTEIYDHNTKVNANPEDISTISGISSAKLPCEVQVISSQTFEPGAPQGNVERCCSSRTSGKIVKPAKLTSESAISNTVIISAENRISRCQSSRTSAPTVELSQTQRLAEPSMQKPAMVLHEHPTTCKIQPRIFFFTSTDEEDRVRLSEIVWRLGGKTINGKEFDSSCTHLICGTTVRNEKLLCSISIGLWVIEKDYVFDSGKANSWLNEADYEWGNPSRMEKRCFHDERSRKLALACRRWRIELNQVSPCGRFKNRDQGAFSSWCAVMYMNPKRFPNMKRLLEWGGGRAQLRNDVDSLEGVTHALVENNCYLWNEEEIGLLVACEVKCFKLDFIATYLMEDPLVEKDHYHADYKRFLAKLGRL